MSPNQQDEQVALHPEYEPQTQEEMYNRVHFYVLSLGDLAASEMNGILKGMCDAADDGGRDEEKQLVDQLEDAQFHRAIKEILLIWLQDEVVRQGRNAPNWFQQFMHLAQGASDAMIPKPPARQLLMAYADCRDIASLYEKAAFNCCKLLQFGDNALNIAPIVQSALEATKDKRRQLLILSFTGSIEDLSRERLEGRPS